MTISHSDLRSIARALGGEVSAAQVLAPGPNHDRCDRSMSVKLSASSPDGFICHSFAGDDFKYCRDYVKSILGMAQFDPPTREPKRNEVGDDKSRINRALEIWRASADPRGTIVEAYLRSRALDLEVDIAGAVLRFHPACPWRDKDAGETLFVPCMVAAMRSIATDEITAIHRTRLSPDGVKLDRRMLGIVAGAAVKLDADDAVTHGLAAGEGVETCVAARQLGIRPVWALGSTSNIAALPVLSGVACLTILAENDDASAKAIRACGERWHAAGREVMINRPTRGNDLNDAIRGAA
jgi:putative DNA primase/helicase